jgi:hypothetical protein
VIDPRQKVDFIFEGGLLFSKILSRFFGVFVLVAWLLRFAWLQYGCMVASLRFAYPIASPLYCFASLRHYLYEYK